MLLYSVLAHLLFYTFALDENVRGVAISPSLTVVCAPVLGQAYHSKGPIATPFHRSRRSSKTRPHLEGTKSQGIHENATWQLFAIRKNEFQEECSHQWKRRWIKCVVSERDYFEGD